MQIRLATAAVLIGVLAASASGAQAAGPKVLDGKKVKVLTLTAAAGLQDHDSDNVTELKDALNPGDRADCAPPRCAKLLFVYKPAKGVKGNVAFDLTWTNVASDFDLYVASIERDGTATTMDQCGGSGGSHEKVYLDASNFKAGKTYALVADFYRSVNDTVTGHVTMPGADQVKKTAPDPGGFGLTSNVNCTL